MTQNFAIIYIVQFLGSRGGLPTNILGGPMNAY